MTYRISKRFHFAASHVLTGLPEGHKCTRLHGHNYEVDVELEGTPDAHGFVLDYGVLGGVVSTVIDKLDHRHLNDLMPQPTAERLAHRIYEDVSQVMFNNGLPRVSAVRVHETPTTMAEFRP